MYIEKKYIYPIFINRTIEANNWYNCLIHFFYWICFCDEREKNAIFEILIFHLFVLFFFNFKVNVKQSLVIITINKQ